MIVVVAYGVEELNTACHTIPIGSVSARTCIERTKARPITIEHHQLDILAQTSGCEGRLVLVMSQHRHPTRRSVNQFITLST
jgi:hypothetical protein